MAGGKSKKKRNSKDSGVTGGADGDGDGAEQQPQRRGSKSTKAKKSSKSKAAKYQGDIFSASATENAYYVCHNVQDVLKSRGFAWPEAQKKKKKGRK